MVVDVQPQFLTQSGVADCSCTILDSYNFPVPGIEVTWSHNCGVDAEFLDSVTAYTNSNGAVTNRLLAKENLSFPV